MIPREEYYLQGIGCTPFSFPLAAKQCTERKAASGRASPVLMHHFIITFDRRDVQEFRIDGEMAQELAAQWAERCIPGFICVIGTHTAGNLTEDNLHCHVILNSVRDREMPSEMEHPVDVREGRRFHTTPATIAEMQRIMAEILREHQLRRSPPYPSLAARRVSDRERIVRLLGQQKLDRQNAQIRSTGGTVTVTEFLTEKEKIRRAVDDCVRLTRTTEELRGMLFRNYGIAVWEKKGIWQYRIEETGVSFSCNSLGRQYWRTTIEERLQRIREGNADPYLPVPERRYEDYPLSREDVPRVLEQCDLRNAEDLRRHLEELRQRRDNVQNIVPRYRERFFDAFREFCRKRNEYKRLQDPRYTKEPVSRGEYRRMLFRALKERLQAKGDSESLRLEAEALEQGICYLEESLTRMPERTEPVRSREEAEPPRSFYTDRDDR